MKTETTFTLRYVAIFFILALYSSPAFTQSTSSVRGTTQNAKKSPLSDVIIRVNAAETKTDVDGKFGFDRIPAGQIIISARAVGYSPYIDTLSISDDQALQLTITLLPADNVLSEVVVQGQTDNQRAERQAIRAIVVDTREAAEQPVSLAELMNRAPGIRIRQSSGLGNQVDVSINGFQGRAIKYFKDGIPLDYLGEGYSINTLPVEMLERIEVYKGVLPISLGADALGGALNLVPRKPIGGQSLNIAYEVGSFNTHKASLIGRKVDANEKWYAGTELFFNRSDNDYSAWVEVPDPGTRNLEDKYLPLFHNGIRSLYGEAYFALTNRSWADELRLSLAAFDMSREQQHPALFTDAYGALTSTQRSIVPSLRYKKSFLSDRLHLDQFAVYNILHNGRVDTLRGRYDWYGTFTPGSNFGETRLPSQSAVRQGQAISRTHIQYDLSDKMSLALNYVYSYAKRDGEDPYGPRFEGTDIDVLSAPASYSKGVLGLGLTNRWWDNRMENNFLVKHYAYRSEGTQNTWFSTGITELDKRKTSDSHWGIAEAIMYQLDSRSFLRASVEYAYRLPERDELFGNNVFIVPNFELKPEKSFNANLGYQIATDRTSLGANVFFRDTEDLLLLVPIQAPNAQYQNQENVRGYGFDLDVSYRFYKNYRFTGNMTWQDLRLRGITNAQDTWKNDARLRNTPYFFGNLGLNSTYNDVFGQEDQLHVHVHYNFLREFYLETIPKDLEPNSFLGLFGSAQLNTDLIIPNQHLLNAGVTYRVAQTGITLGAEVRNILDAQIFDYYRIPRPGRNISFKINYNIK